LEYLIIGLAAATASGLTLFSGFGLGTLLMPVFILFFPVDVAIAVTAIVHLLNNILKLILLGRYADREVVIKFGIAAVLAALIGAWLLVWLFNLPAIYSYELAGKTYDVSTVNAVVGLLMIIFAVMEMRPVQARSSFDRKYLPVGGLLSGFFGGLSGHQGALRSAFLIRSGLSKESFIATGVVIACVIDISRLFVYSSRFKFGFLQEHLWLVTTAVLAAFAGVFVGNRLLKKITLRTVQLTVAVLLFLIAAGLLSGLL
jgi:uncharacterized membrane protein YfcA